jgi:all-trans-8'-apo-beta-carotenal 15,15'-oxygenase
MNSFPSDLTARWQPAVFAVTPSGRRITPLKAATLDKIDASTAVDDVWNGTYRVADWEAAYNSLPADVLAEPKRVPVEGTVPASLRGGMLYRCSPANFDRGGERYKHVLDGDGFVLRVAFDQEGTTATVTGRYVETQPFVEETQANKILYRNTFGTQPTGGALRNAFTVTLKNVANTNVISWGGRLLALWEAGAPHELDATTLETVGEALDLCRGPPLGKECTRGVTIDDGGMIDGALGFGESFTAHPHVDGDKLVAFTWAQQPQKGEMRLSFRELRTDWTDAVPRVSHALPDCALAPHDFGLTERYHVIIENRASISMAPFVLGLKGPAQVLEIATKVGARCHLIPRAGSGAKPVIVEIPPFFCIHVGEAWEDSAGRVHVITSAWDLRDPRYFPQDNESVPFLGAWSGRAPEFERIPPSLLFETVVDPATGTLVSHENPLAMRGLNIEHPHVDGRGKIWTSLANDRGISSPPSGYVCYNRETGEVERWYSGPRKFCEEPVVVPKGDAEGMWLLGMIYDAATDSSAVNVFDGDRIAAGPVAVVPLPHAVPHGLHGCFQPRDGPMSA